MKLILVLLCSLSLTSLALAAEEGDMDIGHGANGELILTDPSCARLLQQHKALCEWKKNIDPSFVIPATTQNLCKPARGGKFNLTVSTCLPDFSKKYAAKPLVRNGPNCWGTTMNLHGLTKTPRFLWPEEMLYWMDNTPICRKLDVGEALAPGDVINVFYPEYAFDDEAMQKDAGTNFWESLFPSRYTALRPPMGRYTGYHGFLHTVTYISPDLAFGKDSPAKDDRFYFHPMRAVYGRPGSGEVGGPSPESVACQENQSLTPYLREYQKPPKNIRDGSCAYFSVAYRCGDIPKYFAQAALSQEDVDLWKNVQQLQAEQAKLFPIILSLSNRVATTELARLLTLSDETVLRDQAALKEPGLQKTREMLLTLEYFTAAGIRQTLEQAEFTPAH